MAVLGIVGNDGMEFAVCTAMLLTRLGQQTAVIDKSPDKRLMETLDIPDNLKAKDMTKYNDVLCVTDAEKINKEMPEVVNIITYYGPNSRAADITKSDHVVLTTDMKVEHIKNLSYVKLPEQKTDGESSTASFAKLVITHFVNARYGKEFILHLFGRDFNKKDIHIIPYNEKDYCFRLTIGNGKLKLSDLSQEMKETLVAILTDFFAIEYDKKLLANVFRG